MENSGANEHFKNGSVNDGCLTSANDNIDKLDGVLQLPEIEFQTRKDLIGMVQIYAFMQGYATSIKNSVKDRLVIIGCDKGGTYRDKLKIPMESRKRKTSSRLTDCHFKVCGRKRVGRPISIALTIRYSHVFVMDCTYKTNKYKMPLLDIVGVTSFNTSFYSCFTFLQKEEVDDYIWALKRFKDILGVNCEPLAIVTDRELALMKAITVVFSTTSNILCVWHIEKNILTNCKSQFQEGEDWEEFMKCWRVVINSQSEDKYNRVLEYFEIQYKEKTSVLNYIKNTWLHLKEHFVCAWTEKHTHFGTRVTSMAEGAHALLKRYLQVSTGDLSEVKNKLCLAIENQFQEIKTQFESEKIRIPHHLHISLFKELLTHVSVFALNELHKQYKLVMSHEESLTCKNHFMTVMGMPCAHKMKSLGEEVLHLNDIHSQWRLDTRSFLDNDFTQNNGESEICGLLEKLKERYVEWPLERQQFVLKKIHELVEGHTSLLHEPRIQPHKGRPTGSKNKKTASTRRDPSAFEFVEKIRKCSIYKT